MDLYPITDKNTKPFSFHKLFLYIAIIILVILLFKQCHKPAPQPVVITGKEVHDSIYVIDKEAKHLRDSFMVVLNRKYKDDDANYQAYLKLLNENAILINQNEMLSQPVPDTCQKLQQGWIAKVAQIKTANDKKDIAANRTITGLQSTVSTQKKFMASKDSSYNRLKSIADTCAKALTTMAKIKPKREINVGIEANSQWTNFKPTIGVGLGYRDRKGNQVNIAVYSNQSVTVGYKKTLFKF